VPLVGVEPTTSAFWFVPVSWLPGLSLCHSFRHRQRPSSLYTCLPETIKPCNILLISRQGWLGITLEIAMKCMNCGTETTNPKYCSRSCAASHNNRVSIKRQRQRFYCKSCGAETKYRRSYCSTCSPNNPQDFSQVTIAEIRSQARYQASAWIRKLARRIYYASEKPKCCLRCGYTKHFEICHVRSIQSFSDQTPMSVVNALDNLVALCPNCHWEYDHGLLSL
jgi:hypothetical protein